MSRTPLSRVLHFLLTLAVLMNLVSPDAPRAVAAAETPPPPPVVTVPSTPVVVNAATCTIGGAAMVNTRVEVYVDANGNGKKDKTEKKPVSSQQLTSGATSFSIATPLTRNATNRFVVIAVLASGLESASTPVPAIAEDSQAPVISGVSDAPDPFSPNSDGTKDTTTISYSLSESAAVTVSVLDATGVAVRVLATSAARSAGLNAETWDGQSAAGATAVDGTYTYQIDAADAAGNGAARQSGTVTLDTLPPAVAVTSPTNGALTSSTTPTLVAIADDPGGVASVQFQLSSDGGASWSDIGAAMTTAPYNLSLTTPLVDGAYQVRAVATDAADNATTSPVVAFAVDATPPSAPTGLAAVDHPNDAGGAVELSWTVSSLSDAVAQRIYRSATSGSGYALIHTINDNVTSTYADTGLGDGVTYFYVVRAVDGASNESVDSSEASAMPLADLDTTPPDTSITSGPADPTTSTDASFAFTSTEANSSFECQLDGSAFASCTSPTSYSGLAVGGHSLAVRAIDPASNVDPTPATFAWTIKVAGPVPPPDPASVAPPLDRSVATDVFTVSQFLYGGLNPIQTGVVPGAIQLERAAVLRGKVKDTAGTPLPLVTIAVLGHPEFGQTLSRADGMFDLAVNGGGLLTVDYTKEGYLPAQRQVDVQWQDLAWLPDVVLIQPDTRVTAIDLTAQTGFQVAQGSVVADSAGTRQAGLFFPSGTQAELVSVDGTRQALTSLHVRATEYTVGNRIAESMPAALPPQSGYTYAVELSADEAAAEAASVEFGQALPFYLDNFLYADVGSAVPAGYYDRLKGTWVASDSGRVVKILSVTGGLADLDVDGDGVSDDAAKLAALGVTDAERAQLALLHQPGKSLWRVLIRHFSAWDLNWGFGPPPDATYPNQSGPEGDRPLDDPCASGGSTIECENQVLGESVDLVGTSDSLNYSSGRVPDHNADRTIRVPLSGATVPASLVRIELEVDVAGQQLRYEVGRDHPCLYQDYSIGTSLMTVSGQVSVTDASDLTNQSYTFTWDGKDAYSRAVQGRWPVSVRVGYTYCGVYQTTSRFGYSGPLITGSRTRQEVTLWQKWETTLGTWDALPQGIGGWTLDEHHAYDPIGQVLHLGGGQRRSAEATGAVVDTLVISGADNPWGVATGPDGYVYWLGSNRVYKVDPRDPYRNITVVAGSSDIGGYGGDGGPATAALLYSPQDLVVAPDGSVYIADTTNNRIRKVGPDGIITTVAGNGGDQYTPDGSPAIQSQVYEPLDIALSPDGSLYILHTAYRSRGTRYVRRVGPDGILTTAVGKLNPTPYVCRGEGGLATEAEIVRPYGIDVGPDGSIYIAASCSGYRVYRVTPDGYYKTVAGGGSCGTAPCGDGSPATSAMLFRAMAVAVKPDGGFAIIDEGCIRKVGPEGIITTIAGICTNAGKGEDGGLATQTRLSPTDITYGPDGNLYIAENYWRVRRVSAMLPGLSADDLFVASEDGAEVYVFTHAGRHLRTLNALTGAAIYEFGYDAAGRLTSVTDGDGNITTVERDASGNPMAIVAPFGQRTTLSLDANGYLASIANPANETVRFVYTSGGLLTGMTDERNNTYQFDYDPQGRLTRDADPAGGYQVLARTKLPNGYEVARTTALGRTTRYRVEYLSTGGQRRIVSFPDGTQSELVIGADGSRATTTPDGTVTTILQGPDPRFGMQAPLASSVTVRTPGGLTYTATASRTASLSDPHNLLSLTSQVDTATVNGRAYTSTYTAATRTFTDTTAAGRQRTTTVDAQGRVVREEIAGLLPVDYTYDTRGRLTTINQGTGTDARITTFAYNSDGYLATIADPLNRVVGFGYDAAGRVIQQTLPDNRVITYGYDASGNQTRVTPPGRPDHTFGYTPVDLQSTYTPPDVGIGNVQTANTYNPDRQLTRVALPTGQNVDLGYDSATGKLVTVTLARGEASYSYNATTGWLSTVNAPGGLTLSYGYDGALVTGETWGGTVAGSVGRTYDDDFRLVTQSVDGGASVSFQYDGDSLLTRAGSLVLTRSPQNGLLTGTTLGNVADAWLYSGFGELRSYSATYSNSTIYSVQYSRDKLGRISEKTETIGGVTDTYTYIYDLAGRLAEVKKNGITTSVYGYDANGNRLSHTSLAGVVSGIYDDQDRLLQYGTATYTYTANGELLSKTIGGQTTAYTYDELGNLVRVALPDGTLIEYVVDGLSRRVGKKVNGVLVQGFLYQDGLRSIAELDGSGNVVARFVYGAGFNVPDYIVQNGVSYRIIYDHLGSPRLVVNTTDGAVVQRLDYDAFGNVLLDTEPGFQPFGFSGGLYDADTGLVRLGMRDYEPSTARWATIDPILFWGGEPNLYGYSGQDPLNAVDPFGLADKRMIERMLSLYPKTDKAYPYIQRRLYKPEAGEFSVIVHGNDVELDVTPEDIAKRLKRRSDYRPGMPIKLISCRAGSDIIANNPAQRLANALGPGSKVLAPNVDVDVKLRLRNGKPYKLEFLLQMTALDERGEWKPFSYKAN